MSRALIGSFLLIGLCLLGMNHYFQTLDNTPKPIYDLPQTELPSDVPLQVVDAESGKLKVTGWSRYPNKYSYNPFLSQVYWPVLSRQKQWNYFYLKNSEYLVTMAHANVGVVKSAYINILKIGSKHDVTETVIEDYFGSYVYIDVAKNGNGIYSVVDNPELQMSFVKPEGAKDVQVSVNSQTKSHTISANLTGSNWSDGITHIEKQTEEGEFHSFNTKLLLDFTGGIQVNGKEIISCTQKNPCHGLHDNGRSVGKYTNSWVWGTATFNAKVNKKTTKVGINISLSEKPQVASGDVLWVDGKLYKLDALKITKESDDLWHITTENGTKAKHPKNKVDIKFKVADRHKIAKNMIVIEIDFNSNFGYFSGSFETEDGHKIKFDNEFGFVEEMFSRW